MASVMVLLSPCDICLFQVSAWISAKLQIATDESYRDASNLQGKIQKQQAFEAELTANKRRLHAVNVVSPCVIVGNQMLYDI